MWGCHVPLGKLDSEGENVLLPLLQWRFEGKHRKLMVPWKTKRERGSGISSRNDGFCLSRVRHVNVRRPLSTFPFGGLEMLRGHKFSTPRNSDGVETPGEENFRARAG